jgi:hypothetical protein
MFRAYAIYAIVFVLLIGGLWLILLYGSALNAPQDVSGAWDVEWRTAPPGTRQDLGPEAPATPDRMLIEQSGRFCTISFKPGPRLSMKMVEGPLLEGGDYPRRGASGTLVGGGWKMTLARTYGGELYVDLSAGKERYSGVARRPPSENELAAAESPTAPVAAQLSPPLPDGPR